MKAQLSLKKVGKDEDFWEFEVTISDGRSVFVTNAYASYTDVDDLVAGLDTFKHHLHGGIFDMLLGQFGPEYAGGALKARLHFHKPSRLYVSANAESAHEAFTMTSVASTSTLYFSTEPAALDNFIAELKTVQSGDSDEAHLRSF